MANNAYLPALLVLVGGLLYQAPASALNPTGKFTVKYTVVQESCSFDSSVKTAITLPNIDVSESIANKSVNVPVSFTCNEHTPSVTIYATGTPAGVLNPFDFKNTSNAQGLTLVLLNQNGNKMTPSGSVSSGQLPVVKPISGKGQYTFKVQYGRDDKPLLGGIFTSTFTLNFKYP